MNRGDQGSITFDGGTYQSGQSASYLWGDYWITGNPPLPTTDWFFYRWVVSWIGSQSWVDNQYAQSTGFHLRGEVYLEADFYSPIHTNDPTSPITWGTRQHITGTATQYSGQQLTVVYYPEGSGMGPPNPNGVPPFGGSGYYWTTVTVSSGSWNTGMIVPSLPIALGQQLPQTYDVYACWASGGDNEVDSNVVSFTLNPASAQIAAPMLTPNSIKLNDPVTITDQIFSSAFVNSNDLTGALTVQAKKQGEATWTDVASQSFTSSYGYSSVYGEWGVYYDLSKTWTPTETGTYEVRVKYSGNNLYLPIETPPSSTLVVTEESDFGISVYPTYNSVEGEGTVEYTTTVTSIDNFNSEVSLTATATPSADITLSFDQPSITPPPGGSAQSTLQATTTSTTPLDEYIITVTGSSGGREHSTTATLSVRTRSHYTIIFIPLNWQGDLSTFYDEVQEQASFLIDNVGILTWTNTDIRSVGQNLVLDFDKTVNGWQTFNGWNEISQFAFDGGYIGDRYVALTNEGIWGDAEGLSNFGPVVVVEPNAPFTTAHELGHSWGLLDEYDSWSWSIQALAHYSYPIGFPPNSYPGDEPGYPGESLGRMFDSHRCIMGSADAYWQGNPIDRAYCPPHTKDEGSPVGVREYEGCAQHVDNTVTEERSQISAGLVRTVITFYRNGSAPTINEMTGLNVVGKPYVCFRPQNFSLQVHSQTGTMLYTSNVSFSFWVMPSVSIGSNVTPIELDEVTVTWMAAAFCQGSVNVTLKDNTTNQTIASQTVTVPPIIPDVSVLNVISSKTLIGQGSNGKIYVDVQNEGKTTETFNVTVYANATSVASKTIILLGGNFTTVTLLWNTTGVTYGNYTIKAVADVVPGETDNTDNTIIDGTVMVTIQGDINGDKTVNILDAGKISAHWYPGPPIGPLGYGPNADLNNDGKVNILDAGILSAHWFESW